MSYGYRARLWATPSGFNRGLLIWQYEVRDRDGVVVAVDDCADYKKMQDGARRDVAMFSRMTNIGYKVKPWSYWLAKAGAYL